MLGKVFNQLGIEGSAGHFEVKVCWTELAGVDIIGDNMGPKEHVCLELDSSDQTYIHVLYG